MAKSDKKASKASKKKAKAKKKEQSAIMQTRRAAAAERKKILKEKKKATQVAKVSQAAEQKTLEEQSQPEPEKSQPEPEKNQPGPPSRATGSNAVPIDPSKSKKQEAVPIGSPEQDMLTSQQPQPLPTARAEVTLPVHAKAAEQKEEPVQEQQVVAKWNHRLKLILDSDQLEASLRSDWVGGKPGSSVFEVITRLLPGLSITIESRINVLAPTNYLVIPKLALEITLSGSPDDIFAALSILCHALSEEPKTPLTLRYRLNAVSLKAL